MQNETEGTTNAMQACESYFQQIKICEAKISENEALLKSLNIEKGKLEQALSYLHYNTTNYANKSISLKKTLDTPHPSSGNLNHITIRTQDYSSLRKYETALDNDSNRFVDKQNELDKVNDTIIIYNDEIRNADAQIQEYRHLITDIKNRFKSVDEKLADYQNILLQRHKGLIAAIDKKINEHARNYGEMAASFLREPFSIYQESLKNNQNLTWEYLFENDLNIYGFVTNFTPENIQSKNRHTM